MATGILATPVPPIQGFTPAEGVSVPWTATGYTPTPYTVKPESLVQEQVKNIVGADSPLMQQARTKASQTMNARGLLNSTLNTQAGQEAVISQALPIATADAATYDRAMTNTANQQNAASQFGAAATNTASQTNAQLATQMNTTNANAKNQALSQEAQAANTRSLAVIDNNTKVQLSTLDNQNRLLLQTSVNAANMYQEAVKNIAAIAVDPNLTQAAKDAATATQINLLKQGLKASETVAKTNPAELEGLDIAQLFGVSPSGSAPIGKATPIPGTNPFTSQWSDGATHTPPKPGFATQVQGWGWWGSDGRFYQTQAEAINLKGVLVQPAPAPTTPPPEGTPPPAPVPIPAGSPPPPTHTSTAPTEPTSPMPTTKAIGTRAALSAWANNNVHNVWLPKWHDNKYVWLWKP
jgi:hypothetical protein